MAYVTASFEYEVRGSNAEAWEEVFDALMSLGAEGITIEGLED